MSRDTSTGVRRELVASRNVSHDDANYRRYEIGRAQDDDNGGGIGEKLRRRQNPKSRISGGAEALGWN